MQEHIRRGTTSDLNALAALEAASYPPAEGATREQIRERLRAYPDHFWILETAGEIRAFVNGPVTDTPDLLDEMYDEPELHRETGAWQMIFSVVTAPAYRGRGCAGRLLRRVIADARAQGRRGLVLTCKEPLLPFYGRLGFVSEGISESTHGGAAWYQMRLRLNGEEENYGTEMSEL